MVWIGSSSSSLRKALSAHYEGHILSADPFYIGIDLPAETLCEDLSSQLLECLLPKLLLNAVSEYGELAEYLTEAVSSEITENGEALHLCTKIKDALLQSLSESDHVNIEGLLCFRLKQDLADFYRSLTESIGNHRNIYEKNRLLGLLRGHIRDIPPQIGYLCVVGKPSEYYLYDIEGRSIRCIFPEDYTPEEHLLNSLLYLSPAVLDLSALDHPDLRDVLAEIFADRLTEST